MGENILFILALCLLVSFILSELFFRMKYPRVIGQVFAGIVLGFPVFYTVFTADSINSINLLSDIGVIFLLMLAGLEINLRKLIESEKDAVIIAVFCAVVPFILGYVFAIGIGYSKIVGLVLGASLALTAEGTTLEVLMELNALNTKIGTIILSAGIVDDLFEVILLSIILIVSHKSYVQLILFPAKLLLFVALAFIIYKLIPTIIGFIQREKSRIATFSSVLLIGILVALLSQSLELGPIIGAFIAGIIIQATNKNIDDENENVEELKVMTFSFIVPFFFINIGMHMNFKTLLANIWLVVLILIIAIIGKVLGALLAVPFTKLRMDEGYIIGWGMNSRGGVELVIAEIARTKGLIPIEVYSAIVIMAITTTLIFPFIMKAYMKKRTLA
ncbi:cation:proton antiporter [Candidatus Woesearchaeota archaeon]|nr:cation:proton antiporter [Candidatus Woesearchaeota archaeon]